jgi:hypothetical protein
MRRSFLHRLPVIGDSAAVLDLRRACLCACVCACVCARGCVRVGVCVCVRPLRAAVVEQAVVLRLKAGESEWTVVASRLLQHASLQHALLQHATLQAPQQHKLTCAIDARHSE